MAKTNPFNRTLDEETAKLAEEFRRARKILQQWETYKSAVGEQLLTKVGLTAEEMREHLIGEKKGSLSFVLKDKQGDTLLTGTFSLELKVDQKLAEEAAVINPGWMGTVLVPTLKPGQLKYALALGDRLEIKNRGPYLTA